MKFRKPKKAPRSHYRDRHRSLQELPIQSTVHGFGSRIIVPNNEDYQCQLRQPPTYGVLSLHDGSLRRQAPDELAPEDLIHQRKKGRARGRASTVSGAASFSRRRALLAQIVTSPSTDNDTGVGAAASIPDTQYQSQFLSPNGDDTSLSSTISHQYQFQGLYPAAPTDVIWHYSHHVNGDDCCDMGLSIPGLYTDFAAPNHEAAFPNLGFSRNGLVPIDVIPQISYAGYGPIVSKNAFQYHGSMVLPGYCSGLLMGNPGAQAITTTGYGGSSSYFHDNELYSYNYDLPNKVNDFLDVVY